MRKNELVLPKDYSVISVTNEGYYTLIKCYTNDRHIDMYVDIRLYSNGEFESCHCGIGKDFIWTDWEEDVLP